MTILRMSNILVMILYIFILLYDTFIILYILMTVTFDDDNFDDDDLEVIIHVRSVA